MKPNNGDLPAFPMWREQIEQQLHGLTKREQFAMAAMQGILSTMIMRPEDAAEKAVKYANALLAELERVK